jgi:hypothetical protein
MRWKEHFLDLESIASEFQADEQDFVTWMRKSNCKTAGATISDLEFAMGRAEAAYAGALASPTYNPSSREAIDARDTITSMRATMKSLNQKFPAKCVKAI